MPYTEALLLLFYVSPPRFPSLFLWKNSFDTGVRRLAWIDGKTVIEREVDGVQAYVHRRLINLERRESS